MMSHSHHVTPWSAEGTIAPAHLLQLILSIVARNDEVLHDIKRRLNAMSTESQALLVKVGDVEGSSAALQGLAQALKAAVDAGGGAVAALAAEQAAHASTNVDVSAAAARLEAVRGAEAQAVVDNTPT